MAEVEKVPEAISDRECPICRVLMYSRETAVGKPADYICKQCGYIVAPSSRRLVYAGIVIGFVLLVIASSMLTGVFSTPSGHGGKIMFTLG